MPCLCHKHAEYNFPLACGSHVGYKLPKFPDQWPQARSMFTHLSKCLKILQFSNCYMIREMLGSPSLYSKLVLGPWPHFVIDLGQDPGRSHAHNSSQEPWDERVFLQFYHVQTVHTLCLVMVTVKSRLHPPHSHSSEAEKLQSTLYSSIFLNPYPQFTLILFHKNNFKKFLP